MDIYVSRFQSPNTNTYIQKIPTLAGKPQLQKNQKSST